ncbi:MAG: hypothetical protein KC800_33320 [Candidatus Eremiobacteraeota bacterium]|nr:hypothetical protein [Candidatus Eremiobacteraeota bacterium]
MAISNIQNFNSGAQLIQAGAPQSSGAAVAAPQTGGLASPGVTNFAQNMAQDGSAIKSMGANAMNGLFGGGQGGGPMMAPPSQGGSGYDNDRAVALLKEKIGAGKTTGDDLFAAQIASSGEQQ